VAAGDSYFSRFFTKFVEISAAGVATAVSGFVLAHFAGYLNSPQTAALQSPAALQAPATTAVIAPVAFPPPSQVSVPQPPAPQASAPAIAPPPAQPARTAVVPPSVSPLTPSPAAALRKSLPSDKPAEATADAKPDVKPDTKPRDVTDTKPRSPEAIQAEVRAALAKADAAAHPVKADTKPDIKADAKPDTAQRRVDNPLDTASRVPIPPVKPRPADVPTGAIAATPRVDAPRTADLTSQPLPQPAPQPLPQPAMRPVAQPAAQQTPMQIAPVAAPVEIKSMPVAGVDGSTPQQAPQADAQARPDDGGLFSAFRHLPEKLRDDKPLPPDLAPRPPADVGQ
jgi:hypothetical protein